MSVVNLNKYRKAANRAKKKAQADENAVKFGQSKAVKSLEIARSQKANKDLDGKKRDSTQQDGKNQE